MLLLTVALLCVMLRRSPVLRLPSTSLPTDLTCWCDVVSFSSHCSACVCLVGSCSAGVSVCSTCLCVVLLLLWAIR